MAAWGVTLTVECPCGAEARQDVGQALRDGRVCWDAESHCPTCGAGGCLGFGVDGTPRWVRDPLIARHGTARLRLTDPAAGRVAVLKTLREAWHLTLPQAGEFAAQLADQGLVGTLPEVAWLRERLAARGVPTTTAAGSGAATTTAAGSGAAVSPWDPSSTAGRG
ncbi:hypothetical protein ACIQF6_24895 [Kitasatospora sp. NPDC092948]|uniref:hypothetical protein n=1 Tax=Kitasatospora sp. NPDC092948 TaxID=3364088 RepID=UPI003826183A